MARANRNDIAALRGAGEHIQRSFESQQDEAKHALREVIAKATRELEIIETNPQVFQRTDWIEQPAGRYHDAIQQMIGLSAALHSVLGLADHLEGGS